MRELIRQVQKGEGGALVKFKEVCYWSWVGIT